MKKTVFTGALLLLISLSAHAQLKLPIALKAPIEKAIANSADIQNKQLDVEKILLERSTVLNKYIPTVEATAGYSYLNNNITMDIPTVKLPISGIELFEGKTKIDNKANVLHGGVMAKTILFSGMQIQNGAKALQQKAIGDSLLIETDKDKLMAEVVQSFDLLKLISASEKLIAESEIRLKKEEERVNKAIENGFAIPYDRDKIKLARLELETKSLELDESKKILLQKLSYLTTMSPEELQIISYELSPFVLEENLSVDKKQELEALNAYKNASDYLIKKEKGSYLPNIGAFAGLSYTSLFDIKTNFNIPHLPPQIHQPQLRMSEITLAPTLMVGIALKWEVFDGFHRKHKVHEAEINKRQIENKLSDSHEKLNLLLNHKLASYATQWKQIDIANQQERIAKNTLSLADKQYIQGLISISQRLEAENDYYKAGQRKVEVLINQRKAALETLIVTGKTVQNIQYQ